MTRYPMVRFYQNFLFISGIITLIGGFLVAVALTAAPPAQLPFGLSTELDTLPYLEAVGIRALIFGGVYLVTVIFASAQLLLAQTLKVLLSIAVRLHYLDQTVFDKQNNSQLVAAEQTIVDIYKTPAEAWWSRVLTRLQSLSGWGTETATASRLDDTEQSKPLPILPDTDTLSPEALKHAPPNDVESVETEEETQEVEVSPHKLRMLDEDSPTHQARPTGLDAAIMIKQKYAAGRKAYYDGNYERAVILFNEVLKMDANNNNAQKALEASQSKLTSKS